MTFKHYLTLIRFDKPVGTLLLFWPVAWALWLASDGHPPIYLIIIFSLGVFLMRSAGCIINDIADRKLDKHVARTKNRPLASGSVSIKNVVILFVILLLLSASLLLFLNILSFYIALVAAALTCLYPLCKRFTHFPQLVLGITFNMGVLVVYAAHLNTIPAQAVLLYLATIFWTLAYDTLYAMSDKEDDLIVGIKSTAIKFGRYASAWVSLFYAVFLGLLFLASKNIYVFLAGLYIVFIVLQAHRTQNYFRAFQQNGLLGLLVLLALIIAR